MKEMLNLSQQDYVKKIDDMNKALCLAWDRDQKVKALKIAIQVHLINNTSFQCAFPYHIPYIPGWEVTS